MYLCVYVNEIMNSTWNLTQHQRPRHLEECAVLCQVLRCLTLRLIRLSKQVSVGGCVHMCVFYKQLHSFCRPSTYYVCSLVQH